MGMKPRRVKREVLTRLAQVGQQQRFVVALAAEKPGLAQQSQALKGKGASIHKVARGKEPIGTGVEADLGQQAVEGFQTTVKVAHDEVPSMLVGEMVPNMGSLGAPPTPEKAGGLGSIRFGHARRLHGHSGRRKARLDAAPTNGENTRSYWELAMAEAAPVQQSVVRSSLDTAMLHLALRQLIEGITGLAGDLPLINSWLNECVARGLHPDDMTMGLGLTGRRLDAGAFVSHLSHLGLYLVPGEKGAVDPRLAPRSKQGSPDAAHARQHEIDLGDRTVRRIMSIGAPDIAIYENFLSDEECEFIKAAVDGKMSRSSVVGRNFTNVTSDVRRSYGAFLYVGSHPTVSAIEARVARLTGVPADHGEGLQVLHYEHTDEYQPHFDFFEPGSPDEHRMMEAPGNRIGTLIFYLNDVEEGGSTYFPRLDLAVHPKKGSALWFSYLSEDGVLDQRTEHAGLPILQGTKWIATKWLRERPYN